MTDVSAQEFLDLLQYPVRASLLRKISDYLEVVDSLKYPHPDIDRPEVKRIQNANQHIIYVACHHQMDLSTLMTLFNHEFKEYRQYCTYVDPAKENSDDRYERLIHIQVPPNE